MGLDYSYLLYFKREHLWDALQGVVSIAEPHHPPTRIHFPDHELSIPLDSWLMKEKEVHHDDAEFSFSTVLYFEEDEAIEDYFLGQEIDDLYRGPPGTDGVIRVRIGYIYLTVYNDLTRQFPQNNPTDDLILLDFGTTGTRMSMLFYYSTSIRKTFVKLLERYQGVCGVFNKEDGGGDVFWFKGEKLDGEIDDAYLMPGEIKQLLKEEK